MDWISIADVQSFHIKRKLIILAVATCLILVSAPMPVSCWDTNENEGSASSFEKENFSSDDVIVPYHKRSFRMEQPHHQREGNSNSAHHSSQDISSGFSSEGVNRFDYEGRPRGPKNGENQRKRLHRNRNRGNKQNFKSISDSDYDETMEKRVTKEVKMINNNLKYLESDKKYFDYYPIEDVKLNDDPKDYNIRVILLTETDDIDEDGNKRKTKKVGHGQHFKKNNTRRTKRDVRGKDVDVDDDDDHDEHSQISEIREKRDLSKPEEIQENNQDKIVKKRQSGQNGQYFTQSTQNDPWHNRFLPPQVPVNYYLQGIPQANPINRPYVRYPIPGNYYNPVVPGYLPPTTQSKPTVEPDITLGSRFGEDTGMQIPVGDTSTDRIIWGSGSRQDRPGTEVATKRPTPPLIHRAKPGERVNSTPRPAITDIRPVLPVDNNLNSGDGGFITRPSFGFSTPAPLRTTTPEPSSCVWAIVNCCARDYSFRYACFEQRGCHGAFWGYNPCADVYQDAALQQANSFFN